MKKLLIALSFVFLFSANAWATTYYAVNGTKNWSSTTTSWDLTSSAGANLASAAPTASIDVIFDAAYTGTMTVDTTTCVAKTLNTAVLSAGTITLAGANKLTVSGSVIFNATSTTAFAPTSNAADALTIAATGTLTLNAGNLLSNFSVTAGTLTLGNNVNFSAVKTNVFTISTGVTLALGTYTVLGNSAINRVLITTNTLGTTLTNGATGATTTTFNNVDLRDIKLSTAGALDLTNSQVNSIGDCGGNSATGGALTFTTADTETITGNSANWSTAAWSGALVSRVPLPQDNVVISMTAAQTLTVDVLRLGKNISFTTATKLTLNNAVISYGSLNFTNSGVLAGVFSWIFESQARSGTITLTSAGKVFLTTVIFRPYNATMQLQDAFSSGNGSNRDIIFSAGTFDANNFSVTCSGVYNTTGINPIVSILMGNGTWTLNYNNNGRIWSLTSNTSITAQGSTISINLGSNGSQGFYGGGRTYNNLSISGTTYAVILQDSNTWNTITVSSGSKVTLVQSTTQTVSKFRTVGTTLITLKSDTGGTAATLTKTGGGTIQTEWCSITDINVSPANTWYYGNHATYVSGTGWTTGEQPNFFTVF